MTIGPFARDADTEEFLNGTAAGEFLLRHCPDGHFSEPAAASCTTCGSPDVEYKAASGHARLVSWAVTHGKADDGSPALSVLAIGELEEGPWWWSCIPGADPDGLSVGAPLSVDFERAGKEHEALPVFRLV
ncbi:MAG TPA: hypothetical protein VHZ96_16130 [Frankiaceae bacterium]|jgi:hypothetical protein|nr:hypothetical protein [Frankiaceae bacterium]